MARRSRCPPQTYGPTSWRRDSWPPDFSSNRPHTTPGVPSCYREMEALYSFRTNVLARRAPSGVFVLLGRVSGGRMKYETEARQEQRPVGTIRDARSNGSGRTPNIEAAGRDLYAELAATFDSTFRDLRGGVEL